MWENFIRYTVSDLHSYSKKVKISTNPDQRLILVNICFQCHNFMLSFILKFLKITIENLFHIYQEDFREKL